LGDYWFARGDFTQAMAFADRCLDIATRTTSRKYVVRGQRLRGEIALAQRQWDEAKSWLRQALSLACTVGNPPQLWKSYLAMGHLQTATQQSQLALESYQATRNIIDYIKMTLQDSDLRMSLDHSPLIQQVYDLSAS
jgi:tetratricopeptide (TPR) repeat protein